MAAAVPARTIRIPRVESTPIEIGNDLPLTFICGPCQLESRQHALETAEFLRELFRRAGAGFIYKTSFDKANRSSLHTKRGAGLSVAGPIFEEIRTKLGVPVLSDVHLPDQCEDVAAVVDVLQIPAFLCRQTDLLVAAAETGKPINVKKGQFLAPWDMKNVLSKITGSGNPNVMACERGASFGYNTLVSDMRALPILKSFGVPVVFDATHSVQQPGGQGDRSGGERQYVPVLARAAVAIGVASVFIEAHPDPDNAPSDGPNMVPFSQLEDLVRDLVAFDRLAKQTAAVAAE
jgi:2-dehydro-3-deoxyphosphooctonate aldolase (KDO 8-P synthase)